MKSLHIVCHDVPYPADYGGVYDLLYKIKALHQQGVLIHLHCFEYGRGEQEGLNKFCKSVTYYKRRNFIHSISFRLPYIVSSRANTALIENLQKDDLPVLLEGIHCTYFLNTNLLQNRKVFVRLHNVEFDYYSELAKSEKNPFKKFYFIIESKLLKRYEGSIADKALFLAVTEKDKRRYIEQFNPKNIDVLPVFLPFTSVESHPGTGAFCLYHGNLSVAENEKAVTYLLENIFHSISIPLVIAGKNPPERLEKIVHSNKNACLVANPSEMEMQELIQKAQIHILPSFNKTGIKIKLINALFNGRFVVTNFSGIEGTTFVNLCEIADGPGDYKKILPVLFNKAFSEEKISERKRALLEIFNNEANARQLIQWIY